MPMFDLQTFLRAPSRSQLEGCRKKDLLELAVHFGLTGAQQMSKVELQERIVHMMEQLQLLPPVSTSVNPLLDWQVAEQVEGDGDTMAENPAEQEMDMAEEKETQPAAKGPMAPSVTLPR